MPSSIATPVNHRNQPLNYMKSAKTKVFNPKLTEPDRFNKMAGSDLSGSFVFQDENLQFSAERSVVNMNIKNTNDLKANK